ncbi:MAG: lipase family protein [Actinomycetes bacterium]
MPRVLRASFAAALLAAVAFGVPAGATTTPSPDRDPFYTYRGSTPLADINPGTVLDERPIKASLGSFRTPVAAEQLLYRTTDQLGAPSITVTTVLQPMQHAVVPKLVGYLSFYDGLGPKCDPSYTLNGGRPDSATEQQSEEEDLLINWYLSQGLIVTVPDFEGTGLHWMAGRESGYGTLDGLRATESYLRLPSSTRVGLSGYSGGAVAADWAAELAPAYAPQLNLVGIAAGGVPVDYWHMFDYINGDVTYSPAIPAMLIGLARAYHVDLSAYLSSYGVQVATAMDQQCMTSQFSKYGALTVQKIMKPEYQDLTTVPVFVQMLNEQIMGTAPGHPRVPFLLGVGNVDGRGDGVMSVGDVEALAREYCNQNVNVEFQQYRKASHITAGAFFDPQTGPFLQERLAGGPPIGNCHRVGKGTSIDPVPMPS